MLAVNPAFTEITDFAPGKIIGRRLETLAECHGLTAVLAMASGMGLGVVAEGVETQAQRQFLIDAGCETVQGVYFARPLPVTELETRWLTHTPPQGDTALVQPAAV